MKKANITGWKDIYNFTLIQTLKNKAFIISFVIFVVLSIVSMPLVGMLSSNKKSDGNTPSSVKKVYVNNETTLPSMDFKELLKEDKLKHITFKAMQEDYDTVAKRIEEKERESIILSIKESAGNYSLNFVRASKGAIKESSLKSLAEVILKQFEYSKINSLGITMDQLAMIRAEVRTKVSMTNVNGVEIIEKDTTISSTQYWFIYGILFVVLMVNVMASTQVATSIVTEKSTRVIEYLLTSVKPLAIIVGKILAMLTAVLLQIISMGVVLVVSNKLSSTLVSGNSEGTLSQLIPKDIFKNLNIINIVFCLILILLGMIFYATLAGLTGATVSRMEEISEGLKLFTFTNLVGSYMGIAAALMLMEKGLNGFVIFSFLFPLSSPFILPGAILIGKISLPMVAGAIVLQIIFIVLLFKFVAKVYGTLILHNGNNIKFKELIKISKTA